MAYTPTAGTYAKLTFGTEDLPAKDWKADLDGKAADASNFRDGRKKEVTLPDGSVTCTVCWDQDDQPTATAGNNLRLGTKATLKCYVDGDVDSAPTKFFSLPVIVTKLGPQSVVQGGIVEMAVTFELNGAITYPVDA